MSSLFLFNSAYYISVNVQADIKAPIFDVTTSSALHSCFRGDHDRDKRNSYFRV
jgi:hypothetical protein